MFLSPGKGAARISSFTYINDPNVYRNKSSDSNMANPSAFKASSEALLNVKRSSLQNVDHNNPRYIEGAKRVLYFMYQAWLNNRLCDVVINVASGKLHAHKLVLCAYSSAMVQECECFPKGNIVSLDLTDFSKDVVLELLYFVYTTNVNIHDGNIHGLVQLATELDISILIEMCQQHLNRYDITNALTHYEIAEDMGLPITENIQKFICENFIDVVNGSEFLRLSNKRLGKIIKDERIYITSDLDIFLAIVRWINHDAVNRLPLAPNLLVYVRFTRIQPEILVSQVEIYIEIFEIRECHNMLYEAMKYHALSLSGSSLVHRLSSTTKHTRQQRRPSAPAQFFNMTEPATRVKAPRSITVNYNNTAMDNTTGASTVPKQHYAEQMQMNPGNKYVSMPSQAEFNSLVNTLKMDIPPVYNVKKEYTVQPQDQQSASVPVTYPSGVSDSIESITRERKVFPSLVVVSVGGIDVRSSNEDYPGRCLYRYDEKQNTWSLLTMMGVYTHHHTSAAVAGKLYVIGGVVQDRMNPTEPGRATNSVRMFDCESGAWIQASPMMQARSYITAAVYKHAIYVAGGEDESKMKLDTIEKYEATFDKWVFVARMRGGPKFGTATCVYKNFLYIVGGYNADRSDGPVLTDVECYDLVRQKWIDRKPLKVSRCHSNLVVANGKMYLVGGRTQAYVAGSKDTHGDRLTSMSSIAMYDDANDLWFHVADMVTPRLDCGCTAIGSKIFIIGGMHTPDPTCLDLVECINTDTNTWVDNIAPLPQPAAGLSCVTL